MCVSAPLRFRVLRACVLRVRFVCVWRCFAAVHTVTRTGAREAHPREDHLLPLLVVAGAAGADSGERLTSPRPIPCASLHIPVWQSSSFMPMDCYLK